MLLFYSLICKFVAKIINVEVFYQVLIENSVTTVLMLFLIKLSRSSGLWKFTSLYSTVGFYFLQVYIIRVTIREPKKDIKILT